MKSGQVRNKSSGEGEHVGKHLRCTARNVLYLGLSYLDRANGASYPSSWLPDRP